ncbi:CheY-like chemotaxis protein [Bradyrhizobium sp. USDA 4461]
MKYVLVVEDNPTKLGALKLLLSERFGVKVSTASSIAHAYTTLQLREWDLIVLDMTFQASHGAGREISKEALAGVEVLQYIQRSGLAVPVIVATAHTKFVSKEFGEIGSLDDLHLVLRQAFPMVYRALVWIDLKDDGWKGTLSDAIEGVWGATAKRIDRRR